MITVRVDNAAALAGLQQIKPSKIRSQIGGGIRRSLEAGKQDLRSRVTARYTRPDIAMSNLRLMSSGMKGKMTSRGRRHSLIKYLARPSTRPPHNPPGGITVYVRRGQAERLPHAFIGKGQIFEREGRARLPLKRYTGPANAQMVGSKHIAPQVELRIRRRLEQEIEKAIGF